jgi:hypothetical protein
LEGIALKVTIDSSEPLDDALRVIGALYDVTLTAASSAPREQTTLSEATPTTSRGNRGGRRTGRAAKTASRSRRAPRKAAAKRPSVTTAQLRTWARDNGHEVSDRGPISETVAAAYREAQQA